jgi:hypothetical protein
MKVIAKAEWRATAETPKPDVSFVPAMARRRLTEVERAALSVAHRALADAGDAVDVHSLPVVFASRWGEIGTTLRLMRQMHDEGEMSPAGFSSSVHNAAPGQLSLLLGDKAPYTAVAAGPASYDMGLLEASTYPGRVLFVYAEETTPEMYRPYIGAAETAHAVAILIDNGDGGTMPAEAEG